MISRFGVLANSTVPVIQAAPIMPEGGGGNPEEPTEGLGCWDCAVGGLRIDGDRIEGFGRKLKRATKKVGKVYKKAGRAVEKGVKKALPVAAAVAPFVPGVGVVAAGVLGAASKAVAQRRAAKRAEGSGYEIPTADEYSQEPAETVVNNPPMLWASDVSEYGPPAPPVKAQNGFGDAAAEIPQKGFALSAPVVMLAGASLVFILMRKRK